MIKPYLFDESSELIEVEIKKTKKFDRMWKCGYGGSINTEPLIINGILYFGSTDGNMYALDCETGKELWRFKTNGIIFESGPQFYKGLIFFGSFDGCIYAVDAKNGKLVWKFKTGGEIGTSAFVWEDCVYFGSRDGYLYCLEKEKGKLV